MVAGMETSSGLPYRRSVRLKGWIYRDGIFFITICTRETRCTLGQVENDRIVLSPLGEIVQNEWLRSNVLRPGLVIDDYVIMPNHMHALVYVPAALGSFVRGFKGAVTRSAGHPVWQRNYHEHIVRGQRRLKTLSRYIAE